MNDSDFRHVQDLTNTRIWLDDDRELAEQRESELASFSPLFWVMVRFWFVVLAAIAFVIWYQHSHRGHSMSNPEHEKPAAPPSAPAPGESHGSKLKGAIQRFAEAYVAVGTHPDTGMFFFDAKELAVNEKLETLKTRALVDTLCAAGLIERSRFENRLKELVTRSAEQLEEGAAKIAMGALHNRPIVDKPNGH